MRTINCSTSLSIRGRPGARRACDPSNLRAMSLRYHARMVSGRAVAATSPRAFRPSRCPISPSFVRSTSESFRRPFNWDFRIRIVQLLHGALHRFTSATMDAISSPPPHSISFGGFRTPAAEHAATSLKRPASETLHNSGLMRANSIAYGGDEELDKPREDRSTLPIENQSFVSSGEGVFIPAFSFPAFDSVPGVLLAKHRPKFPTALRGLLAKPLLKQDR